MDNQELNAGPILQRTRNLFRLRSESGTAAAAIRFINVLKPVVAFYREYEGETLLCAFNLEGGEDGVTIADGGRLLDHPLRAP